MRNGAGVGAVAAALLAGCVTTAGSEPVASSVAERTRETCGATWSLAGGDQWGSGRYVVGVFPEPERAQTLDHLPTPADVQAFIDRNAAVLKDARNTVGSYCERKTGDCQLGEGPLTCWLDVSRQVATLAEAAALARACNQKSIAKLDREGVKIVEEEGGRPFGDGKPVTGPALAKCVAARGG